MDNDLVSQNIGFHSDLRKAQDRTIWCRLAATDTVTHSGMDFANDDDDDDIYDSEHLLK